MNSLKGKIALITGATSGIGKASAERFAKAGAAVVVTGRNRDRGEEVVKNIQNSCGEAMFCELDVRDDDSITYAVEQVRKHYNGLDVLFNNAGVYPVSPALENINRSESNDIMDINVSGIIKMIQACFPMLKQSHGVVLNNASVAGLQSYTAGQSYMYCASKAAVIKITQLLAKKYGAEVRVNCICPGIIRTPLFVNFDEERYKKNIPLGRIGEAEEVAAVANFLVSEDAAFINGCVLTVDGGQSLGNS